MLSRWIFFAGGRPPHDFVVSKPDGEQVWHWKCAKETQQQLDGQIIEPGELMEFTGEWEQVNRRGEPCRPAPTWCVEFWTWITLRNS